MPQINQDSTREAVLAAVAQNGEALKYAAEELRADKGFVLAAVAQNGEALKYAADELRANQEVVLAAVAQTGWALEYAADELKNDASFFWHIWHIWNICNSRYGDEYLKEYINQYLVKETTKTVLGAYLTIASALLLSNIIALPFPALVVLIASTVIGAIYTINKVAEHGYGFFKARAEFSIPVTENKLDF